MTKGHFQDWEDKAGPIRTDGEDLITAYNNLEGVYSDTKGVHNRLYAAVEGDLATELPDAILDVGLSRNSIQDHVFVASGVAVAYGDNIDKFNTTKSGGDCRSISELNAAWTANETNTNFPGLVKPEDGKVPKGDESKYADDLAAEREEVRQKLRAEHGRLETWMEGECTKLKGILEDGPTKESIMGLWKRGALPSYSYLVFPHFDFNKVKPEAIPIDLRSLSAEELQRFAANVPIASLKTTLEGEIGFFFSELSGKLTGEVTVMMDGSVTLKLHAEAGLELDISNLAKLAGIAIPADVDAGGGVQGALVLNFSDEAEAKAWLDGLKDAVFADKDIAQNLEEYIAKEDVAAIHYGGYGTVSIGTPESAKKALEGEVELRGDFYVDAVSGDKTTKVELTGSVENEKIGSASLSIGAEVTTDDDNDFKSLTISGKFSAAAGPGLNLPESLPDSGDVNASFTVTEEMPHYEEILAALGRGDAVEATRLAAENGQGVFQVNTTKSDSEEHDYKKANIGVEVERTTEVTKSVATYVKPPGMQDVMKMPDSGPQE